MTKSSTFNCSVMVGLIGQRQFLPMSRCCSRPAHWRERAIQRQRFWSRAHGFEFGRKLGD
jgi:hypothetical protein